jgi:hypothetical protein
MTQPAPPSRAAEPAGPAQSANPGGPAQSARPVDKGSPPTTHPERRGDQFDDAPSTSYEYANGDRGDKSGVNLEQDAAIRGRPGDGLPDADWDVVNDRPAIRPSPTPSTSEGTDDAPSRR